MSNSRILIVDDEPKVAFFFQKNLEWGGYGYVVDTVNSGECALQELKKTAYDLLITDFRMPKMNGLELLQQVREISPNTQTILVTAYGTGDVWAEADRLDTFRSLSKPLKINDLLTAVREALAQPQKQRPSKKTGELVVLSGEHFEDLSSRIERLRVDVGAHAVILADTEGHVLTYTGAVEELNLSAMMALLGGLIAASGELSRQLKYDLPVHLSYFEGPPYDLYAANVSFNLFLTIVYDRRQGKGAASRIGLVWLYTHRALEELQDLLGQQNKTVTQSPLADDFAQSLQGELDGLFENDTESSSMPTVVSVKPSRSKSTAMTNDAYYKIKQMLTRFGEQTDLVVESNLAALNIPLPITKFQLLLTTMSAGLKNVYQHSQATIIKAMFSRNGRCLQGSLIDNGVGFIENIPPTMHSLGRLQQEFEQIGGQLQLQGQLNRGATLNFNLPIDNEVEPCHVH